ncbi:MAG TPA: hypothetical protein VNR51_11720, partial [Hyphomicrobium sp.]|nr:hypothetical protein [Hyphomicrobium sp.]
MSIESGVHSDARFVSRARKTVSICSRAGYERIRSEACMVGLARTRLDSEHRKAMTLTVTYENLDAVVAVSLGEIAQSPTVQALEETRVGLLGKKGSVTELLKSLGAMDPETRRVAGAKINQAKQTLMTALEERRAALEAEKLAAQLASDAVDVTLPGRGQTIGGLHPVTRVRRRIEQIFRNAGFTIVDGPEIEDDWHNFGALNIPENHPARAM